ncbi:hypothetical protein TNCV_2066671 [Trichonephila clavipes]|uniref:Uncharacterized protein n=1 Tax=Trichonephila clavipes TaxID=2585209 RepID=A0A8X7BCN5_TRICX|nr:hypothetical protein TNCV_2066671 [Trichonephila clavipes]
MNGATDGHSPNSMSDLEASVGGMCRGQDMRRSSNNRSRALQEGRLCYRFDITAALTVVMGNGGRSLAWFFSLVSNSIAGILLNYRSKDFVVRNCLQPAPV